MVDFAHLGMSGAKAVRELLGDGNYGGYYARSDEEMAAIWGVALAETRALLTTWAE